DISTVLFLCTSQYPTPPEDVNILKLNTLKECYSKVILGLSDHTQGNEAAVMAVALGARVFEKHFTMDHNLPGPDHWFSVEPEELKIWVESIHKANKMLGLPDLKPTKKELEMRKIAHRSITCLSEIKVGEVFTEDNIGMRRPGTGLSASKWDFVIGKKASHDLKVGHQICMEDIEYE
ncbi:MAG: N-acetylneuraminate synthase family protein, partial [Lachnospiraceae bacterium]|nr:N-acetylneuraminate synthase family protein [Lachnospiraceae bacterium]